MSDSNDEVPQVKTPPKPITFKEFLERTHPSVEKPIDGLWKVGHSSVGDRRNVQYPNIRLDCQVCKGERTFRSIRAEDVFSLSEAQYNSHPYYICGDCGKQHKQFALRITFGNKGGGLIYKYGEIPPFGVPVPSRVLRLFGRDAGLFVKGRQCENLGYGIAAFAYYRRMVENHRNDLFNEIIKVCQTVGASADLIDELTAAKREISFANSMEKIKTALPQGLLIDGHNPLNALHTALSVGLHGDTDEECLDTAQAVRLVLSDLVERIALLKQDNKQLSAAVQSLLNKKSAKRGG
jgi:hypothetical protein